MICKNCGNQNAENARYCGFCGQPLEMGDNQPSISILCPQHKKDDNLQSVPALVNGGIVIDTFSGSSESVSYVDGKSIHTSGYSSLSGNSTTQIAKLLSAPPEPKPRAGFWFYAIWWTILAYSLMIIIGPFLLWSFYKKSEIEHDPDYPRRYTLWKKAKDKWDGLYYCHRCGIVFDPKTKRTCAPHLLYQFLYE